MVGWHHQLDGHGFGWAPGVGDGQGGLACCGSWGLKESDMTERLNWTELFIDELTVSARVYFWVLCPVPLSFLPVFVPILYCFDYCNVVL